MRTPCSILLMIALTVVACTASEKSKIPEFEEYVTEPMLLKNVAPVVPHDFLRKGITGAVRVKLLVDEQGVVREAKATKGPRKLRKYAKEAVLKRRYKPYMRDGQAVPFRTWATIAYPPEEWTQACDELATMTLPEGVYRVTEGISAPTALVTPDPEYSEEARVERVMGTLCFAMTVSEDGTTRDIILRRGIGYGLDEKAAEVLKQWQFIPGSKDGQPVPVQISVTITFRLY